MLFIEKEWVFGGPALKALYYIFKNITQLTKDPRKKNQLIKPKFNRFFKVFTPTSFTMANIFINNDTKMLFVIT